MNIFQAAKKLHLDAAEAAFIVADSLVKDEATGYLAQEVDESFLVAVADRLKKLPRYQEIISSTEAAEAVGVHAHTINKWRLKGTIVAVSRHKAPAQQGKGKAAYHFKLGDVVIDALRRGVYNPHG